MTLPAVAIIVPACNEEASIAACLRAAVGQSFPGRIHAVVAVNGSSDRTAAVADGLRAEIADSNRVVSVVEIDVASKTAALNAGDATAKGDIRIYLDADARLSSGAVAALVGALGDPAPRLAAPRLEIAAPLGPLARACARVWLRLPPVADDVVGGGCYALNRAGRARFSAFPALFNDDGFVRSLFQRRERSLVREPYCAIPFPNDEALVEVWARWIHGNLELKALGQAVDDSGLFWRRLRALLTTPELWPDLPTYLRVRAHARVRARQRTDTGDASWPRGRT